MQRLLSAVSLAAVATLVAACGSAPWWKQTGSSNCGPPAMVHSAGRVINVGDCAGLFVIPAKKVTLHVSAVIDVHMTEETTRASGNNFVAVYPLPHSSASSVLRRISISPDKATATYRAQHSGHAILISPAECVGIGIKQEITGSCPVLNVTVIP